MQTCGQTTTENQYLCESAGEEGGSQMIDSNKRHSNNLPCQEITAGLTCWPAAGIVEWPRLWRDPAQRLPWRHDVP